MPLPDPVCDIARIPEAFAERGVFAGNLLPQAIESVMTYVDSGVAIIAGGGVYSKADSESLFKAGVKVVAIDTLLWYGEGCFGDLFS